jgi:hypothetical protein
MAHYAFLDENNIVTEVIPGKDENETIDGLTPEEWYADFRGQRCIRTSYNRRIRYNYAGIGYTYDPIDDAFIAPQPYASWILDNKKQWQAPIAHPQDGKTYYWNEESGEWHEAHSL